MKSDFAGDLNNILSILDKYKISKKDVIELDYITEKHLEDAQNNVIDTTIYNDELENTEEIYYGIQGLKIGDETVTGYNNNDYISNW